MNVVQVAYDIDFLPIPNEVRLVLDSRPPPSDLTTSALGLFFWQDKLLMTRLEARGWDIPGGHVDPNEAPEEAIRREVYEETGAEVRQLNVLGYQKITIHAVKPEGYRYPHPVSYQLLFCGEVAKLHSFEATEEASERGLFGPTDVDTLQWVRRHRPMYDAAYVKIV